MIHALQITVEGYQPSRHALLADGTVLQLRTNRDDGPDPIVFPGTPHHDAVIDAMRERLSALKWESDQIEHTLSASARSFPPSTLR
jgi:hypothetical protein